MSLAATAGANPVGKDNEYFFDDETSHVKKDNRDNNDVSNISHNLHNNTGSLGHHGNSGGPNGTNKEIIRQDYDFKSW